ncbi:MAG: S9 family peptidase [Alphaproteobacteria bacterium]
MSKDTQLISRQILFGNPDKSLVRLSPNGKYLSYLAAYEGVMNVWVQQADLSEEPVVLTHDKGRGIQGVQWMFDGENIIFLQDANGDENWRLFSVNVNTKEIKTLTDIKNVQVQVLANSYKKPEDLLIGLNNRNPQYHDVYRIHVPTGKMEKVYENNKFAGFSFDEELQLKLAVDMGQDGGLNIYKTEGKDWVLWKKFNAIDTHITNILELDKTAENLYWVDGSKTDKGVLKKTNLKTGKNQIVYGAQKATLGSVVFHPTENVPLVLEEHYLKPEHFFIDNPITSVKEDYEFLQTQHKGEMGIASTSLDFNTWLVTFVLDNGPTSYYLYDRKNKTAKYLFTNRKSLEGLPLVPMHPMEIKSRDGLNLVGYLSLPKASDLNNTGRPNKPLPLVLVVHGGPESRDYWGYSAMAQWLTNRGYACLSINYRGSSGFGKSFVAAGNKQFARAMHTDLLDGVDWAVQQKIADPKKVAILGGSYGGYATLVGMTMTPDVFVCGVDIVGMSNLETLMQSIPPYWKPIISSWYAKVGNPNTPQGRKLLRERSPLYYVDNIKKPLLIFQGANDPRVKQAESDQIVKAMKQKNIPVHYVIYPDEGHGFVRPENKISFYGVTESFLGKFLGGAVEPMGDDDKKSSMQIIEKGF